MRSIILPGTRFPCSTLERGEIITLNNQSDALRLAMRRNIRANNATGKGNKAIRRANNGSLYRSGSWCQMGAFQRPPVKLTLADLRH